MKVLIIGRGSREYAIGWKIKSQRQDDVSLIFAPGNGATLELGKNEQIPETEIASLIKFAEKEKIDFTIVGPEAPLCEGIVDAFLRAGLRIFGPNKEAARLEGSKEFTKKVLALKNIPTAKYEMFKDTDEAINYAKKLRDENKKNKVVIKADGLAAGKGVLICETNEEIENGIRNVLENKIFGDQKLLVEEFLWGFETSLIGFFDGNTIKCFLPTRDHKTIYEGHNGPNTGGMGTFTPDEEAICYMDEINEKILNPFIDATKLANLNYKGIVFFGLIISEEGPKVLEINSRFGDPETQSLMLSLDSDLLDIILATENGSLIDTDMNLNDKKIVSVVVASNGYPDKYKKGLEINLENMDSIIFYGGVAKNGEKLVTDGGRVLSVSVAADTFDLAREKVYEEVKKVKFDGAYYRKDIAPLVKRVYVWKKHEFDIPTNSVKSLIKESLNIVPKNIQVYKRYDISGLTNEELLSIKDTILREPPVDNIALFNDALKLQKSFSSSVVVKYKSGQFDQRERGLLDTIKAIYPSKDVSANVEEVYSFSGISEDELKEIKKLLINPVDQEEGNLLEIPSIISDNAKKSHESYVYEGFKDFSDEELIEFHDDLSLAMSIDDLKTIREYSKNEQKDPTDTEISILDTYWSDHCRHTTFNTIIKNVDFKESNNKRDEAIKNTFLDYLKMKEDIDDKKPVSLMNLGTIHAKYMRKKGELKDVEVSDEINACTLIIDADVDGKKEEYLLFFKNETHNHPTEIEPFGGAQTCLGGAIRDPLSGRAYVYQAMRITGASDPINDTKIEGKLTQKKIIRDAMRGYSSYGNQIGLATGFVEELFHPGYKAKRMEVGAVMGAAPRKYVRREKPIPGDVIILLGGRTGRDGVGGATGSSKVHTKESVKKSGAEVQKGHAPTERKIQRMFRNPEVSTMIKKCNDFGAGGVSVAIGELADSLDIYLDRVPLKYKGLTPREIAISESQERMAVVIEKKDMSKFMEFAKSENLEATHVADVTDTKRVRMFYDNMVVCDMSREFMDSTGALRFQDVLIEQNKNIEYFKYNSDIKDFDEYLEREFKSINSASRKNLLEHFDFSVGRATVTLPLGGKNQLTPINAMVSKIPSKTDETKTVSFMSYGFIPNLSEEDPFVGSYIAVLSSVYKAVISGAPLDTIRLSYQEYFEKLEDDPKKWQKPFIALLGALKASKITKTPPIGGKDSMSGSFEDIHVPPTLISFAVGYGDIKNVVTSDLKDGYKIGVISTKIDENGLCSDDDIINNLRAIEREIEKGNIKSSLLVDRENVLKTVLKMSFGSDIKFNLESDLKTLLDNNPLNIIVQYKDDFDEVKKIGFAGGDSYVVMGENISYNNIKSQFIHGLDEVYGTPDERDLKKISFNGESKRKDKSSKKCDKPVVTIAVFEGTNSEYDSRLAFEKAGAEVREVLVKNITEELLNSSIKELAKSIRNSQIFFIPGGFSMSDEPDGSAKFIANTLRNKEVREAIEFLLDENGNDGLILGICNGFQALIKTGLLPYGKIMELKEDSPTLTFNTVGRHISKIIPTKAVTKDSPWLKYIEKEKTYNVPISHGEGRFVASDELIHELEENNQIAFKYLVNPNGSKADIEGIIDKTGKILGKMGHSERVSNDTYKNFGEDIEIQDLFKAGVSFFN